MTAEIFSLLFFGRNVIIRALGDSALTNASPIESMIGNQGEYSDSFSVAMELRITLI